jgi:uncharacterized membrane protein
MRASLKKIGLAAVMALTVAGAALVTAGSAQAQHRHGGGGFGPGFVGGLAAGAVIGGGYYGGGYYGGPYAYDGGCYIQRQAFINRFGHRVIRRVRVCD